MLARFSKEHTHSEDEVRFTVRGSGVFHIHPKNGPVFAIQVESGDLINVPKGTQHWFDLCEDRQIRCIRLFQDQHGWTAHYVDNGVDEDYPRVGLGPDYVKTVDLDPAVVNVQHRAVIGNQTRASDSRAALPRGRSPCPSLAVAFSWTSRAPHPA